MTTDNLKTILEQHQKWLDCKPAGAKANLSWADLSGADLSGASLSQANLSWASLSGADLSGANLSGARLSGARLSGANLSGANLSGASLSGASLSGANLSEADLSGATGIDVASTFLSRCEHDEYGVLVWKAIGKTDYSPPKYWAIDPGSVLTETCNPDRGTLCGSGVNFGTKAFVQRHYPNSVHWLCRIEWIDLSDVVVPFGTDGKARCARLTLIKKMN